MTAPVTDPGVLPVVLRLLDCLTEQLATVDNPPATVSLRPGTQVELLFSTTRDECCEGVGWVRVVSIFPSANFPLPDVEYVRCWPVQWAAVLEMGVARCAPTPPATALTSGDEWNAVTAALLDDAAATRRALCCFATGSPDVMFLAGLWQPLATEGGCLGGTQTVTIAIGACDC